MSNIWFLYRRFTEARWAFYNWDKSTLHKTINTEYASKWWQDNELLFEEVTIVMPAMREIKVNIPVSTVDPETVEELVSFEEEILSDIRIDPKTRIICNKILKQYMYCSWGFFVKRPWSHHEKMHTKNMEVLQLMKDVILWNIRYEPIKLDYEVGKGAKRKRIQYEWDLAEDLKNKSYTVWWRTYKTDIYWVYTRILRKSMFSNSTKLYDFYWWHEFQYFQRWYDLNYWAINYLCASRKSGKTMYGMYNTAVPMFKSKTFRAEFADKANMKTHFFTLNQWVINNYSDKLKEFFYNLLVWTYKLSKEASSQIVEWKKSDFTMYLHTEDEDRTFEFVSERSSRRWERSARITLDECNYLDNYEEVSEFATKSGAWTVNQISTISKWSKSTLFYKNWVKAMIKQRKQKPIDEVIHHVWTKYGFDKIKSREDYKKMVEDGVFDAARNEFYLLRPMFAMKVTLDDVEHMSEEEKKVEIEKSINSVGWYDWMLAEFFCELSPDTPAINYRANVIWEDEVPKYYDKIFVWYDEADAWDEATLVAAGIINRKLYVFDQYILPKQIWKRYVEMSKIMNRLSSFSSMPPSMIVDIGRWPIYYRETNNSVPFVEMAIKARSWRFEKIESVQWVSFYSVWTDLLVEDIMNVELIWADKIFFSSKLWNKVEIVEPEGIQQVEWLLEQMDNYVHDWKSYKWKWSSKDDLVAALLYCAYYWFTEWIKDWAVLEVWMVKDKIERFDAQFEMKQKELASLVRKPKKSIRSIR